MNCGICRKELVRLHRFYGRCDDGKPENYAYSTCHKCGMRKLRMLLGYLFETEIVFDERTINIFGKHISEERLSRVAESLAENLPREYNNRPAMVHIHSLMDRIAIMDGDDDLN